MSIEIAIALLTCMFFYLSTKLENQIYKYIFLFLGLIFSIITVLIPIVDYNSVAGYIALGLGMVTIIIGTMIGLSYIFESLRRSI